MVGDFTGLGKKMRKLREKERERFTATPDTVLQSARSSVQLVSQLDAQPGLATPSGTETPLADFRQISKARDDLLKVKLDQVRLCAFWKSPLNDTAFVIVGFGKWEINRGSQRISYRIG
jgi:hypothetical protein